MKYIIIPIFRTLYILIAFIVILPLAFLFEVLLQTVWNFKLKRNWKKFRSYFSDEYFWVEDSEYIDHMINGKYKVYLTAKDFILNRYELKEIE